MSNTVGSEVQDLEFVRLADLGWLGWMDATTNQPTIIPE